MKSLKVCLHGKYEQRRVSDPPESKGSTVELPSLFVHRLTKMHWLLLVSSVFALCAFSQTIIIDEYPPLGSMSQFTGHITGVTNPEQFKLIMLVSGDGGNTFWDKTHNQYLASGVADPGSAQNAAIVISPSGSWSISNWVTLDPVAAKSDAVAPIVKFFLLPITFDVSWPNYSIESIQIPGNVINAAVTSLTLNRDTQTQAQGPVNPAPIVQQPSGIASFLPSTAAQPPPTSSSHQATSTSLPDANLMASGASSVPIVFGAVLASSVVVIVSSSV
jgi:hypothetical protein